MYTNNLTKFVGKMSIKITLQSSDENQFKTDIAFAKKWKRLPTMFEDLGVEDEATEQDEIEEISSLPFVAALIWEQIID